MAHLFLSHSSADDGFVRELRDALADLDQPVWIDSRQLKGGDPLWGEIKAAIGASAGLAVLVSPDALQSDWVAKELKYALELQTERGRAAFPVLLLALNGTKPASLAGYFDETPAYIPVSSAPGGATAALHDILVAMGQRLPTDRPPLAQPRPEPVAELVLELSDLGFDEQDGVRRPAARARLVYEPAIPGQPNVASEQMWRLIAPLGPIEAEELRWYLERWPVWPNPLVADRARQLEANLIAWGQALHGAALPLQPTANVLQAWAGVDAGASRRFSVSVDDSLLLGASEAEMHLAQEAATALLALPWELLHNGEGFLFQGARPSRVRRRLPNKRDRAVPVVAPPIRVLLITSRPEDDACGYLDHRASALPLVAATEELGDVLRLSLLHPATYPALEAELARAQQAGEPYHVVHFDGHGVYDRRMGLGGLCFEDPSDSTKLTGRRHQLVLTNKLGPLLNNYRIPLVLLDACQSAQAEAGSESVASDLLQRGVVSVVAMSHSVLVETARRFVAAFYAELARGQRVGQAMLAGQRALHSDRRRGQRYGIGELKLDDWFVPVLYQEKDDPQLFTATPAPQTKEDLGARLRARLGAVPPEPVDTGFVGRSRDLLALERLLRQERWAVVRGQGGEGKTALAAELARWLVRSQQVRRAAFVSVELCSHKDAVLDALGRQLVGADYSAAKYENPEQALLPIERALREQPTLLVIDNMESVLLPPYLETPDLLSEEAALELKEILALAERLLRAGETRLVFTSREALPAPFDTNSQRWELRQLGKADAVALIERSLAAGESSTATGAGAGAAALEARREEIEALVAAVQGHARTLALLAPELRRRGVAATQADLVELMEQMQRQVAQLPADDPRRREQSLFASVELSLRRLSGANRERVRVLGVFHGEVNLAVLEAMTEWDRAEVEALAVELVGAGLATAKLYKHYSLNPALCPYLKVSLREERLAALNARWLEVMDDHLGFLERQMSRYPHLCVTLTLLGLPNLFALLDCSQDVADTTTTIERSTALYILLQGVGKPRLMERVARVRDGAAAALSTSWTHAHFSVSLVKIAEQIRRGQLQDALVGAKHLLQQAEAAGEDAYNNADFDLAQAFKVMAKCYLKVGSLQHTLPLLREAVRRFKIRANERACISSEEEASSCSYELAQCLMILGHQNSASELCEDGIRKATELSDIQSFAEWKALLGMCLEQQIQNLEALGHFKEALEIFSGIGKDDKASNAMFGVARNYVALGHLQAAEEAYGKILAISCQNENHEMQAAILSHLADLYSDKLQRSEDAVPLYRRAAEINHMIGNYAREGMVLCRLAETMLRLNRIDEARDNILRSIECNKTFGHVVTPWVGWAILSSIECDAGNTSEAGEARQRAIDAYLAYRRDGGENMSGPGRLAYGLCQMLIARDPLDEVSTILKTKLTDPSIAELHPFLTVLQAITAGSRDRSLAEEPGLSYTEAAEVLLLIEALEAVAGG
jgi:tetratricopeptide (TPR) repeat protein